MDRTKHILNFVVMAVFLGLIAGGSLTWAASPGEVKIGVLLPLSGPAAHMGEEVYRGAEMAKDIINDAGGVWGQKVVFAKADAPDTNAGVSEANRLINRERVKVIYGASSSPISYAASEVTERNRVIFWEEGSVANNITERGFKYLFRFTYKAKKQGELTAKMIHDGIAPKLGIKPEALKVAVIYEDSNFGTSVATAIAESLKALKINVVAGEAYNAKAVDLSTLILKLKSLNPDVVAATSYPPDAILFSRQAKEYGFNIKALVGTSAGYTLHYLPEAIGDDANGLMSVGAAVSFNQKALNGEAQKLHNEFVKRHMAKYKSEPSLFVATGFSAMYILLHDVLPKAGAMDAEKIREAAMALDLPIGSNVMGWGVKFDQAGDNTRAFPMLSQWNKGKLYTLYPKQYANMDKWLVPLPPWGRR